MIGKKTGVAKTTCYDIYKHALNNARRKYEAENAGQAIIPSTQGDARGDPEPATQQEGTENSME